MKAYEAILKRDLLLAWRSGGNWIMGTVFMAAFLSLCGIALGGQMSELRRLGTALIWLGILFSMLLSFSTIFQSDFRQGSLTQIMLHGVSPLTVSLAKWTSFLIIGFLPLFIVTPLMASLFGLSGSAIMATLLTLAISAPALAAYVTMAGAVLCARTGAGFLAVILVMPFLIAALRANLEPS